LRLLGVLPKPSSSECLSALLGKLQAGAKRSPMVHGVALTAERLQLALDAREIVPWYQPKVEANTGRAMGVEALARWPLANGSMIGPGEFVPLMEEAGLADALFISMVEQVTADVVRWQAAGLLLKVSVNLSMDCAHNLDLPEQLLRLVVGRGLLPGDFVIEVTESQLMVRRSVAMESLTRLSLMGFQLSIDDFGTGYSSLVQLVDLPFKELKIDGSFVQRASQELKAKTILRIATSLGLNLGMGVVAEGVETAEQLQLVRECGCNSVQGYYFAKPMPFKTCSQWFDERCRMLERA
jgi:EAL domain-containing protein (putative c-di-GMP-specific phosphodiesterase class I)